MGFIRKEIYPIREIFNTFYFSPPDHSFFLSFFQADPPLLEKPLSITHDINIQNYQHKSTSTSFTALSEPCLLRILACLSPEDLTSLAQTNRFFRTASEDQGLWRALYIARWPQGIPEEESAADPLLSSWKVNYMKRDTAEIATESRRAPEEANREIFAQMVRARRSEALSTAAASIIGPVVGSALAERVAAFRKVRGLEPSLHSNTLHNGASGGASSSSLSQHHHQHHHQNNNSNNSNNATDACCSGGCSFVQLGADTPSYWICEKGGHIHICGDACTERQMSVGDEMLVCSITGRCFPRLMSEWEEADASGRGAPFMAREEDEGGGGNGGNGGGGGGGGAKDGEDPGGDDWNGVEGMGGRLGRAFFAGYHAVDERELLLKFGVRM